MNKKQTGTISRPSEDDLQKIISAMMNEVTNRPPTVGLVGVSGVGKSSTINSLFKTQLATSDTVACTTEFEDIDLSLEFVQGKAKKNPVSLRVIDSPGLGESVTKDPYYLDQYGLHLDKCDVILWIMSARNRAIALDQQYLQRLSPYHEKMVFAINQADIVEPLDWNERFNIPSRSQENNLKIIQDDRATKISSVLGRNVALVCYSSKTGYKLEYLFKIVLEACPEERRWIYDGLKNFSYKNFIPKELRNNPVTRTAEFLSKLVSRSHGTKEG